MTMHLSSSIQSLRYSWLARLAGTLYLVLLASLSGPACALPPAWSDDSYSQAAAPENRRGPSASYVRAPFPPQRALALGKVEDDGGAGSGNYSFSLPIVSLPGRGHSLSLSLHFASQVWSDMGNGRMVFDADGDWPSPGWSIGFGKIIATRGGSQLLGGLLVGNNKSRQRLIPTANETGPRRHMRVNGDSLTQIEFCCYDNQGPNEAQEATLTDGAGTTISYRNFDPGNRDSVFYPVQRSDANGNYTSITYLSRGGRFLPPMIDRITDTVGREVKFHYDASDRLVTITAPGPDSMDVAYAQFIYSKDQRVEVLSAHANGDCRPFRRKVDQLSGVIFPATRHGLWMPPSTPYGTSSVFYQTTAVQFSASGFDQEPTVTNQGRTANRTLFDYPKLEPPACLKKPPTYSIRTDEWRDDITGANQTAKTWYYRIDTFEDKVMTVVHPDGSLTKQYVSIESSEPGEGPQGRVAGQLRRVENLDATEAVLQSTDFEWETVRALGPGVRQRAIVENIDPLKRGKRTEYVYDQAYPSLVSVRTFFGYSDGQTAGPAIAEHFIATTFVRDAAYVTARLLTLPQREEHGVGMSNERTVRDFEYDKRPLSPVGRIGQHLLSHEPHFERVCVSESPNPVPGRPPVCDEWGQIPAPLATVRGNPTKITEFADGANLLNPVAVNLEYDSTGNVLKSFDDFGSGTEVTYGVEDHCAPTTCSPLQGFSLPVLEVKGSMDPRSALRVATALKHYLGPGLLRESAEQGSPVTTYAYSKADGGWRASSVASSDGVITTMTYDDDALINSVLSRDADGAVAYRSKIELDGRGNSRRLTANRGTAFKVDTEYDAAGRVARQSNPYWLDSPIWTSWTYDGLSRVKTVLSPGNTKPTTWLYDSPANPSVVPALPLAGSTVLTTDPWARRSWRQSDSSGNLRYAVQSIGPLTPEPASPLNALTTYDYDAFGRLRTIAFGRQMRTFAYDSLGRLVGQALPERQATLDASGTFGGSAGSARFSDVFQYDRRSNLVVSIDARGVRTRYHYSNEQSELDPLNRLQRIEYEIPAAHDNSSPILEVRPVAVGYKTTGSPMRLDSIDSGGAKVVFGYDDWGRLSTQTTTHETHPRQPFKFSLGYDEFGRPSFLTYPPRYDSAGAEGPRRTIEMRYERDAPSEVLIDQKPLVDTMVYAPGGRIASLTRLLDTGSVIEKHEFDPATGLLSSHKVSDVATSALLYAQTYGFRLRGTGEIAGQLTSIRNLVQPALSQNFSYDPAGRLAASITGDLGGSSASTNALVQNYRYDSYGNRTKVDAYRVEPIPCGEPGTPACNFTPAGQQDHDGERSLVYDESSNRIYSPQFGYDASGNLTRATYLRNDAQQSMTFIYDAAGRIARVADGSGAIREDFLYGHDRRRIRTINYSNNRPRRNPRAIYTNWFGDLPLSESINDLVVGDRQPIRWAKDTFHAIGRSHSETSEAGRNFFINDLRGTGAEVAENGTNSVRHRSTQLFGTEQVAPAGGDDEERFTTYKRSSTTGLDYAVNRFYSAELGRFLQTDPIGAAAFVAGVSQSLNLYSYAKNDPVNRVDASGLKDGLLPGCKWIPNPEPGKPVMDCDSDDIITVIAPQPYVFTPSGYSSSDRGAQSSASTGSRGGPGTGTDSSSSPTEDPPKADAKYLCLLKLNTAANLRVQATRDHWLETGLQVYGAVQAPLAGSGLALKSPAGARAAALLFADEAIDATFKIFATWATPVALTHGVAAAAFQYIDPVTASGTINLKDNIAAVLNNSVHGGPCGR